MIRTIKANLVQDRATALIGLGQAVNNYLQKRLPEHPTLDDFFNSMAVFTIDETVYFVPEALPDIATVPNFSATVRIARNGTWCGGKMLLGFDQQYICATVDDNGERASQEYLDAVYSTMKNYLTQFGIIER